MNELEKIVEQRALEKVNKQETPLEELNEQYLQKQVEQGKSISEIATDFAKAKATTAIIKNEHGQYDNLHKEFLAEQKETLKEGFKQDRIESQTKTLTEKQKKAQAFYISFRPILEFDFGNLIRKKDDKEDKEGKPPKRYEDRSYGIPLMVLMLCLFVVPYCVVSVLLAIFNGINAMFEAISTFGKIAKSIVLSVFVIAIIVGIVFCALLGIDALFGTSIIIKN